MKQFLIINSLLAVASLASSASASTCSLTCQHSVTKILAQIDSHSSYYTEFRNYCLNELHGTLSWNPANRCFQYLKYSTTEVGTGPNLLEASKAAWSSCVAYVCDSQSMSGPACPSDESVHNTTPSECMLN
jgi:hypothetical protein